MKFAAPAKAVRRTVGRPGDDLDRLGRVEQVKGTEAAARPAIGFGQTAPGRPISTAGSASCICSGICVSWADQCDGPVAVRAGCLAGRSAPQPRFPSTAPPSSLSCVTARGSVTRHR